MFGCLMLATDWRAVAWRVVVRARACAQVQFFELASPFFDEARDLIYDRDVDVRDVDVVAVWHVEVGDVDVVPAYIRVNSHLIASEVSRTTHTCAGCGRVDDVGDGSAGDACSPHSFFDAGSIHRRGLYVGFSCYTTCVGPFFFNGTPHRPTSDSGAPSPIVTMATMSQKQKKSVFLTSTDF